jgi:hypothetical protein
MRPLMVTFGAGAWANAMGAAKGHKGQGEHQDGKTRPFH